MLFVIKKTILLIYSLWIAFNTQGVHTNLLKNKKESAENLTQKNGQPEFPFVSRQNITAQIHEKDINPQKQKNRTKKTTYKDIPLTIWHVILRNIPDRSLIFLISRDLYTILLKIHCEEILHFNISYGKYHISEFSKIKYMRIGTQGFLEFIFPLNQSVNWKDVNENNREIQEILNDHYNEQFPLFFLKFAHPMHILDLYNKHLLLMHEEIQKNLTRKSSKRGANKEKKITDQKKIIYKIEETLETHLNNTECRYRVFTFNENLAPDIQNKKSNIEKVKNKKEHYNTRKKIIIIVNDQLDSTMLNALLEKYKNDTIIRILLNNNETFPFDIHEEKNPEIQKKINNIIIQNKRGDALFNPQRNPFEIFPYQNMVDYSDKKMEKYKNINKFHYHKPIFEDIKRCNKEEKDPFKFELKLAYAMIIGKKEITLTNSTMKARNLPFYKKY